MYDADIFEWICLKNLGRKDTKHTVSGWIQSSQSVPVHWVQIGLGHMTLADSIR